MEIRTFTVIVNIVRVKLATLVKGDPKASFSIAITPRSRGGRYSFDWIALLYPYLIMLSVKQSSIKYYFLSLWYDSTWDWTLVSQIIGEHLLIRPPAMYYKDRQIVSIYIYKYVRTFIRKFWLPFFELYQKLKFICV